jgi:hypothetical protein
VLPGLDRLLDNLWYIHALRREQLPRILEYAGRGRPAAVRALAFWPERVEETAPVLLQAIRRGTRSARDAAREALDILAAGARSAHIHHLERRIDLASAWADGESDGRPGRVWPNIAGYSIKLSLSAGGASLQVFTQTRRLAGVPRAVREHPGYAEVRAARAQLSKRYRYFRRRLEEAMIEGVRYPADEFAALIGSPVVRSLVSRLLISCDGRLLLWTAADAFDEGAPPGEMEGAELVWIVHPAELGSDGQLGEWQERLIRARVSQPFKQLFREVYTLADGERASSGCGRFSGQPVVARRAFALLRNRGYAPGRGDAVKEWPGVGLRAHIQWSRSAERAGRLIAERDATEAVTTGDVWFEDTAGETVPLESVPVVMVSETLRDADLLASRAFAGELGLTSQGICCVRATLVRYLAQDLGLTTIYVSEDENHAIVEGRRALYRVHLGSGTVLLEESRRNLDMGGVGNRRIEDLVSESMDSGTARILGIIGALSEDEKITNPAFLRQLARKPG